jgi:hypothetical protein
MERGISKPNIVKGIPIALIRPLPTLYYFGRYSRNGGEDRARAYFEGSVRYLTRAVQLVKQEVKAKACDEIIGKVENMGKLQSEDLLDSVIDMTGQLSAVCKENRDKMRDNPNLSKEIFEKLHKESVPAPKLMLIDNNHEPDRSTSLAETFEKTCFYHTEIVTGEIDDSLQKMESSDFIIFTSAYPLSINEDVKNIEPYDRPFIVLANLKKETKFDQQTMRNGSWLQSRGHEVLYKIFTPLRLFTTVDKVYMRYHLSS